MTTNDRFTWKPGDLTELDALAQSGFNTAKRMIEENGEELMPVFFFLTDKGVEIVGAPWKNEREKIALTELIRGRLRADKSIRAYVTICEVWVSSNPRVAPSQDPGHQDALMVSGASREGELLWWMAKIAKGSEKRTVLALEKEGEAVSGRMVNLFLRREG